MLYQTEILRFTDGIRSNHPSPEASIAAAEPHAPSKSKGQIAILVDLTPKLPYRSREIRTLTAKTYWTTQGSVVTRLRRALVAANRHVVTFNQSAAPGSKCAGNLTCAALLDEEIFLGQVGPAYAYILHPKTAIETLAHDLLFEIFPRRDRLLIPLGGTTPPVIHISYTSVEPGCVACLATTEVAESIPRERWQALLGEENFEKIVSHLSNEMADRHVSGSVILIRALPSLLKRPAAQSTVEALPPERAKGELTLVKLRPAALTPLQRSARHQIAGASAVATEAPHRDEALSPPPETGSGLPEPEEPQPERIAAPPPEAKTPSRPARATLKDRFRMAAASWQEKAQMRQARRAERRARPTARTITAEHARLRQALRTLLPGRVATRTHRETPPPPKENATLMKGLALGLLAFVLLVTGGEYLQLGGPSRAEELVARAQEVRDQAYLEDPSLWPQVLEMAKKIEQLDPDNEEAQRLLAEAQQSVDALEHASALNLVPLLELGTTSTRRQLLVARGSVYILDTASDLVLTIPLGDDRISTAAEGYTTILSSGQTIQGATVGELAGFAWLEPNEVFPDGAVVSYGEGGLLFFYDPPLGPINTTVQRIQGEFTASQVTAVTAFGSKLYLLHRQMNQVLVYEPVNGIYENYRPYFATDAAPDLQLALDMAIDGRVYLLLGNGTVQAYYAGARDPWFELRNLPDFDMQPRLMAIEPDPEDGLIYLGDPDNARIVAVNKLGEFVHQYRTTGPELRHLEALAVTMDPHIVYLISENKLYAAPIPALPTQ